MNHIEAMSWAEPVLVDGEPLDLDESLAVWRHSPSGFAWGYGGSGPAQLALAILMRFTPAEIASALHQQFKWQFVANWPQAGPLNEHVDVRGWIAAHDVLDAYLEAGWTVDADGVWHFPADLL